MSVVSELESLGAEVHASVIAGDLRGVPRALSALAAPGGGAWRAAVASAAWLLRPSKVTPPSLPDLGAFVQGSLEDQRAAAMACAHLSRGHVLHGDRAALASVNDLHRKLAEVSADAHARLWANLFRLWLAEPSTEVASATTELQKEAIALKAASLVSQTGVLRAVVSSLLGDGEGTALARRASMMARTEALPMEEYTAHLVLGRARRLGGHAHLATHILRTVGKMVPSHWQGWVLWERLMAGDGDASAEVAALRDGWPMNGAVRALSQALDAVTQGDRARWDVAVAELRKVSAAVPLIRRDVNAAVVALDATAPFDANMPAVTAWCDGSTVLPAPELHGLCISTDEGDGDDERGAAAYVFAPAGAKGRRVLARGVALLSAPDMAKVRKTRRKQGRVETFLAALALAGPAGLLDEQAFEAAYELKFSEDVHRGVLEVLVHRARAHVEGMAEILRIEGGLALRATVPLLVPEPRAGADVQDRLLRLIAREGRATAQAAAKETGLSVRAAQEALKRLADDGACAAAKDGRQVQYTVEDTTFSEPTQRLTMTPDFEAPTRF